MSRVPGTSGNHLLEILVGLEKLLALKWTTGGTPQSGISAMAGAPTLVNVSMSAARVRGRVNRTPCSLSVEASLTIVTVPST
jgi:hypothetical protein